MGAAAAFAPGLLPRLALSAAGVIPPGPGGRPFPNRPIGQPQPDLAPELAKIEHFVLVMMENHSFDNYLGMLPHRAPRLAGRVDGFPQVGADGIPTVTQKDAGGKLYRAFDVLDPCQDGGPSQAWDASHTSFNGGRMDGFVKASGEVAMRYWDERTLPFYYSLASTFPVCDRYFCSTLCQTYPNRIFAMAATAAGLTSTDTGEGITMSANAPNGNIFEVLESYGISWATYYTELPSPGLFGESFYDTRVGTHFIGPFGNLDATMAAFEAKVASGTLESVVMLEEDYQWGSEENPQNIQAGQYFVYRAYDVLRRYPSVWAKTLFIWYYDEHGGYYDHVAPPAALSPGDGTHPNRPKSDWYGDDYTQLGFRVPCVPVSPWSKKDVVSHTVYDHTSVLRTIEAKWNLPALTYRDANANDMRDCLVNNLTQAPPFEQPPALVAAARSGPTGQSPADSTYCERVDNVSASFPPATTEPSGPGGVVAPATIDLPPTRGGVGAAGAGAAAAGLGLAALARRVRAGDQADRDQHQDTSE